MDDLAARNAITFVEGPVAPSSLGHMPEGAWKFDESVTAVFDDMLARSIPQLGSMRDTLFQTAIPFVQSGTYIIDLGCSVGAAIAPLIQRFGTKNRYLGIEASAPMVAECRQRFERPIKQGIVEIRNQDLRSEYPDVQASLTLCVLTLMFTPIEHRFRVLADAFAHTLPGGAFLMVEKVLGGDAMMNSVLVDLYHAHKQAMGYSREEVDRKRLALEGVLVPVTAAWNEQMLRTAGFHHVECFWRCLNFSGWIAIKI